VSKGIIEFPCLVPNNIGLLDMVLLLHWCKS